MNRALLLDRDGTLIERRDYARTIDDMTIIDGVPDALRPFQASGWKLIIVTNQAGVALGYLTEDTMHAMNAALVGWFAECGVTIDAVYTCIHAKETRCRCRKPAPGMLLDAAREHDLDLARSWMVGDFLTDVQAGKAAGCKTAYIDDGSYPGDAQPTIRVASTVVALKAIWSYEQ